MSCKIERKERIASGEWLCLEKIYYTDSSGISRDWESVKRRQGRGAVAVIATMKPSGRLLLIRQFRPPANGYAIEFPAGLIDEGESPEECAVRELREETGYLCRVVKVLPPMFSSPGLSGETLTFVIAEVDESSLENQNPVTDFDDSEDIETFAVKLDEFADFLAERQTKGDLMDSKVLTYSLRNSQF